MSLVTCATLVIGGVFAGYVNAVAGGGSAVTIPLLCGVDYASMATAQTEFRWAFRRSLRPRHSGEKA